MLAAGLGVGTLAIGIAIELGGSAPAIGNTVLATVVAWVAIRFRDPIAAGWAAAVGSLALIHLTSFEYPLGLLDATAPEGWPFVSPEGLAAIGMAAAMVLVGTLAWRSFKIAPLRTLPDAATLALAAGCLGAIGVIAFACQFELQPDMRIVGWSALASVAFGVAAFVRGDPVARMSAVIVGALLIVAALGLALSTVVPPTRLVVDTDRGSDIVPLFNLTSVALAAIAVALAIAGRVLTRWSPTHQSSGASDALTGAPSATVAIAGAGTTILYLGSIAIIDVFQTRVGQAGASDEIATQAQVVLSISWVVVGAAAFAIGLIYRIGIARAFGLGLLALATAKVFLFDLSALDVAYRVLSFIGLGGVLLVSSFVAARFRAPSEPSPADRSP